MRLAEARKLQEKARMHEKNPAELLCMLQEAKGAPLKHLKPDSYNRIRPVLSITSERPLLQESGNGFTKGDRVTMTLKGIKENRLSRSMEDGVVEGLMGGMLKVNGMLYACEMWRKV